MKGVVYKATVAGKLYIGKTHSFDSRVKMHINSAFRHEPKQKISKALRTVSEEDAYKAFEVIEEIEGDDYDDLEKKLCERENFYMNKLNTLEPNGYNVAKSYPQRQKRFTHQPPREAVMREVICLETGERFRSMTEASKFCGVDISAVYHCLKGKTNTAGGYHWRYADGEYHECTRPEGRKNRKSQSKPVMCIETGVVYPSTGEAFRITGIDRGHIATCANGKNCTAGGYHWGFVVDGKLVENTRENRNNRRIRCVDTGEEFESITACSRMLGEKNSASLNSAIKRGHRHKGKRYEYIE